MRDDVMKILRYEVFDKTVLFENLKRVTLMNNPKVVIYKDAHLSLLEGISPDEFYPAQYYVLEEELEKIKTIRESLKEFGIDIFGLKGYVKYWLEESPSTPIDILPPVVEESSNHDGKKIPLICDGMHRIYYARKIGLPINVVFIQNVPEEKYPYYAWPNTDLFFSCLSRKKYKSDRWTQVVELNNLKESYRKKDYRWEPPRHKELFRDFNTAFDNVGRVRIPNRAGENT